MTYNSDKFPWPDVNATSCSSWPGEQEWQLSAFDRLVNRYVKGCMCRVPSQQKGFSRFLHVQEEDGAENAEDTSHNAGKQSEMSGPAGCLGVIAKDLREEMFALKEGWQYAFTAANRQSISPFLCDLIRI